MTLPRLKVHVNKNYERLAGLLRDEFTEGEIEQIYQVLCDMPRLNIELNVIGSLHDQSDVFQRIEMPTHKDRWIQVHQNEVRILCEHFAFHFGSQYD